MEKRFQSEEKNKKVKNYCRKILESYVKDSKTILISDESFKCDLEAHIALYCRNNNYEDLAQLNGRVVGYLKCALNVACNNKTIFERGEKRFFFDYESGMYNSGGGASYYLKEFKDA